MDPNVITGMFCTGQKGKPLLEAPTNLAFPFLHCLSPTSNPISCLSEGWNPSYLFVIYQGRSFHSGRAGKANWPVPHCPYVLPLAQGLTKPSMIRLLSLHTGCVQGHSVEAWMWGFDLMIGEPGVGETGQGVPVNVCTFERPSGPRAW